MSRAPVRTISWCWWISWLSWLSWTAAGCGPTAIDDGDGTGSATDSTGGASTGALASTGASASSTADASTDQATRGDTTAAASTGTPDDTDTDTDTDTGEPSCPPAEDVAVAFTVDPDETFSATCTVAEVTPDPDAMVITLDCEGIEAMVDLGIAPASALPAVSVGDLVQLDHVVDQVFWINRWMALRTAGGESDWLLAGGVASSELDPPGTTLAAFFGGSPAAPVVTEVAGLCMPLDDRCGPLERLALDFTLDDGTSARAFDHGTAFIDVLAYGYAFTVEHATRYPSTPACDDLPPAWFELAMVWFASD